MKTEIIGMTQEEAQHYIDEIVEKHKNHTIAKIRVEADGEFANVTYELGARPFDRIRRITGYLVGTTDRWNDAKKAEERDRVKHGTDTEV